MKFIRKIINSDELRKIMDVPEDIDNNLVEVIVLPFDERKNTINSKNNKKVVGKNLISKESAAWSRLIDNVIDN
jgi:hypothetical protein